MTRWLLWIDGSLEVFDTEPGPLIMVEARWVLRVEPDGMLRVVKSNVMRLPRSDVVG